MKNGNVIICPPWGENVGLPTKRGANKVSPILPLLPRLTAVLPPQGREITARAFTLIELLVVVLIIGILAAVAVPQYQKAVEKSKATQALTLIKSVYQAAKTYSLTNGQWPTTFEQLDIDLPWTGTVKGSDSDELTDVRSNNDWSIQIYAPRPNYNGIFIQRISGDYAGGGFAIMGDYKSMKELNGTILCFERINTGIVFTKQAGDFCQKLFSASWRKEGSQLRYYTMP